jgi:pectate lyase
MGWASVNSMGQDGTFGGGDLPITEVDTLQELQAAVSGSEPAVVRVSGSLSGVVEVGSNRTLFGAASALRLEFYGNRLCLGVPSENCKSETSFPALPSR